MYTIHVNASSKCYFTAVVFNTVPFKSSRIVRAGGF